MKTIAVEEHFVTEEFLQNIRAVITKTYPNPAVVEEAKNLIEMTWLNRELQGEARGEVPPIQSGLLECGEGRVKMLQSEGIDMQVVSLVSPGVDIFEPDVAVTLARRANDALSQIVKKHPDRFVGLAALPAQRPVEAADELVRAVRELGLRGACINSHIKGEYLDDKKFWVIFEAAEKLGVPIYLHPRGPSPAMIAPYATYPVLTASMWGFGAETSLHAMRLICSGIFDEYPGTKILLGHLGEALPFWQWRIDNRWQKSNMVGVLKKMPGDYMRENFVVTTSGNFSLPAFLCTLLVMGADNILFAVDHPFEAGRDALPFLEALPISPDDKEKISHLNAERVFGLR